MPESKAISCCNVCGDGVLYHAREPVLGTTARWIIFLGALLSLLATLAGFFIAWVSFGIVFEPADPNDPLGRGFAETLFLKAAVDGLLLATVGAIGCGLGIVATRKRAVILCTECPAVWPAVWSVRRPPKDLRGV